MKNLSKDHLIFATGLGISLLAVLALPNFYYQKDFAAFWEWGQLWRSSWRDIYLSCAQCNYPILGIFSTAGLIGWLAPLGYEKTVFVFRVFLALVDGINVYLVFWLLKKLLVERAFYWAGMVGILLSSWVGGALWGQIDGLSQFLILIWLVWLVRGNTQGWSSKTSFQVFLVVGSLLLAALLLFKQLTIFSVFSLGLLLMGNLIFFSREWRQVILNSMLALATFLAAIFSFDFFLNLPSPYFSHLVYVWETGSNHSEIISGNGFNLWVFLGRDQWSSARVPLSEQLPFLTPYGLGMVFFLLFTLLITGSWLLFLRRQFQQGETCLNREMLLNGIFFLALVNLGFNIFMTGTHERYLYHFYPYLLVAWLGLANYNRLFTPKILPLLIFGANFYGTFMLQIIPSLDFRLGYWPHWLLGSFHLGLLIYLMVVFFRYQKPFAGIQLTKPKSA
jgi:hypothetical protein